MMREQPFLFGASAWLEVRDGASPTAAAIFDRHYSRGAAGSPFVAGPGEKMVLLTPCARALFVWRQFVSKDPTVGADDVNCAVFRNEGAGLSSSLILEAMALAWRKWPGRRLYTYVDPRKVRSRNPGYCFLMAGWRRCGITKRRGFLILEVRP